jgi:hypothetical protein
MRGPGFPFESNNSEVEIVPTKGSTAADSGHRDYASITGTGRSGDLSYSEADAQLVLRAIANITAGGAGIVFSLTQDQSAYSVRVLDNGQVHKWYPSDAGELQGLLDDLVEL